MKKLTKLSTYTHNINNKLFYKCILGLFLFFTLNLSVLNAQDQTYNFNGTSQYASVPYNSNLNPTTFTIEAWALITGGSGNYRAVVSSRGNSAYTGFILYAGADNNWQFWIGNGSSWPSVTGPAVTLNKWTHLAGVYSGGTMTFYVDGVSVGSASATLSANTSGPFNIGAVDDNGSSPQLYLPGDVDEVRLWNTARTATEIRANLFKDLSATESGLVADYKGDVTGTTLTNSCTNVGGLNGNTHNNPPQYASSIAYEQNTLSFDGTNDFVEVANNSALQNSSFSVDLWSNRNSGGSGYETVLSYLGGTNHTGYAFYVHDNKWKLAYGNGSSYQYIIGPAVTNGTWTHLAASYNGTTLKFYVDGVEISSSSVTVASNTTNPLYLGADYTTGGDYFNGKVDEVKIWNTAKAIGQMTNNIHSYFDPTSATNLVVYYSVNQGLNAGSNTFLKTLYDLVGGHNGTITNLALSGSTSNYITSGVPQIPNAAHKLHLKADAGVTQSGGNVTGWTDQEGHNTFTVVGTPGYQANAINFNPAVTFNNTQDASSLPGSYLKGNTPLDVATGFAVYRSTSASSAALVGGQFPQEWLGTRVFGKSKDYGSGDFRVDQGAFDPSGYSWQNSALNTNQPFAVVDFNLNSGGSNATGIINGVNGSHQTQPSYTKLQFIPWIGGMNNGGFSGNSFAGHFIGEVAEIMFFPTSLSSTEQNKYRSYLAIKYGIHITGYDYVNSSGTTIWNHSSNSTYHHDVFGIGKDDTYGLNQTSSNSINTGSGDGTGQSGLGNIMLSSPSAMATGDFLLIGHDNAGLTEQTTDLPSAYSGSQRLAREWKVAHTNDVGTVTMTFNTTGLTVTGTTADDFALLIDNDGNGDFSNGTVIKIDAASYSGNVITFNNVSLPNDDVFTIVTDLVLASVGPQTLTVEPATVGATTFTENSETWTITNGQVDNDPNFGDGDKYIAFPDDDYDGISGKLQWTTAYKLISLKIQDELGGSSMPVTIKGFATAGDIPNNPAAVTSIDPIGMQTFTFTGEAWGSIVALTFQDDLGKVVIDDLIYETAVAPTPTYPVYRTADGLWEDVTKWSYDTDGDNNPDTPANAYPLLDGTNNMSNGAAHFSIVKSNSLAIGAKIDGNSTPGAKGGSLATEFNKINIEIVNFANNSFTFLGNVDNISNFDVDDQTVTDLKIANNFSLLDNSNLTVDISGEFIINGTSIRFFNNSTSTITADTLKAPNAGPLQFDDNSSVTINGHLVTFRPEVDNGATATINGNVILRKNASHIRIGEDVPGSNLTSLTVTGNFTATEATGTVPYVTVNPNSKFVVGGNLETKTMVINSGGTVEVTGDLKLPLASGYLQLQGNATTQDLIVQSGASLTIASDATGTGSLIIEGVLTNNGTFTSQRYVTGGWSTWDAGWHQISSPVTSQPISDFATGNYDFYGWEESTELWMNYRAAGFQAWNNGTTNMNPGQGYLISYELASQTKSFVGTPNLDDITVTNRSLSGGTYTGWHLLGNPFTSALKWNDGNWALAQVAGTAKIWGASSKSYTDIAPNGIIPANQGFMVQVGANNNNSLTIPKASRTHDSQSWYKSAGFEQNTIKIIAAEADMKSWQEHKIMLNENATQGFDFDFDSRFIGGNAPHFYAIQDGERLSTNSLPQLSAGMQIPMGFVKNAATNYKIELMESIDGVTLYLRDTKTGTDHLLSDSPYLFTSEEADQAERFVLHFSVVGIDENITESEVVGIWTSGNILYINNKINTTGKVMVYNMYGQLITSTSLEVDSNQKVEINAPTGYYVVSVQTTKALVNKKVFIQ